MMITKSYTFSYYLFKEERGKIGKTRKTLANVSSSVVSRSLSSRPDRLLDSSFKPLIVFTNHHRLELRFRFLLLFLDISDLISLDLQVHIWSLIRFII